MKQNRPQTAAPKTEKPKSFEEMSREIALPPHHTDHKFSALMKSPVDEPIQRSRRMTNLNELEK